MKILGTGLNGLVGTRVTEILKDTYEFENISRSTGVDITNAEDVLNKVSSSDASWIVHMAAKTNVDGCEKDKMSGQSGEAWQINVIGTQNVVRAAEQTGKKLLYISTDFVFDGEKGDYSEEDAPNPINWYGMTKCEGENAVQSMENNWVIIRPAYPYRASFEKKDFMRAILGRLENGQEIKGVEDHIFCPTFIDDLASALGTLIKHDAEGIYHVTGSQALSPYDAAILIAETFDLDTSLVSKTTRAEYFQGNAPRPFNLSLKSDKIEQLGIRVRTFEEGVREIKAQNSKLKSTK